jgi:pimeloyl-ACP methyl ester carboxylesterase
MSKLLVRRRCFVHLTGYDPVGLEHSHRRFIREMARFQKTWSVQADASSPELSCAGHVARWTIETSAANWRVATDFYLFRWDDFVATDAAGSDWWRLPLGVAALLEFVVTGAVIKYFVIAWRFALFSIYPLVAIAGMAWLSLWAATVAIIHGGLAHRLAWTPILAVGTFVVLRWTVGWLLDIRYVLDLWCFSRQLVHRVRPGLEERLERFARELSRLARETDADEIVIDGHSLGAPLALVILDRALQLDPSLGRGDKALHLVMSGSWLPALALHPGAGWLREAISRVATATGVYWVEFQSIADIINFYNVDPVAAIGMPPVGKPILRTILIRHMLKGATYRRFRSDVVRIHRQAVMGNERRYFYDFYMLCCGPIALVERVDDPARSVAAFTADGALAEDRCATAMSSRR